MATPSRKSTVNRTCRLRVDIVKRLEKRAQERGISSNAALEELVDAALPVADPITRLRELGLEVKRAPRGWRPLTKDELHEDDA